MPIRRLDPLLIDRIAAGEVIERPAAAVKELVENALDAGATRIDVAVEAGGRRLIRVIDDGAGMSAPDLALSVERHATSKIPDGDLANIATLGFRGEALPSIASVSRLEIRSRARGADAAAMLLVEEGVKGAVQPCAQPQGTRIEARDLFAATPARLKFLKSDRSEAQAAGEVVRRLALANPLTRFSFASEISASFDWAACADGEAGRLERARQALGSEFAANCLAVNAEREGVRLTGFAGLPTFSRSNAQSQYFYVNGRAVRDKLLAERLARRLSRLSPARPARRRRFVPRMRTARCRRQCPSRQGRSALSRRRPGARADRRRAEADAARARCTARRRRTGGSDAIAALARRRLGASLNSALRPGRRTGTGAAPASGRS